MYQHSLNKDPDSSSLEPESFRDSQQQDPWVHQLTQYLTEKKLPDDENIKWQLLCCGLPLPVHQMAFRVPCA